jgi:ATP-dependent DNA helicase RecQ
MPTDYGLAGSTGALTAGQDTQSPISLAGARTALEAFWGYPDFRFAQRRVVVAALKGRDVLAVLPTGGGKSICYQVPALLLPGTTVVVSPLISLMQDQVTALERRGIEAAYLSSSQQQVEQGKVWARFEAGSLKLLYVAPERVEQLVARRGQVEISLLAIDEAHCISEWGHDFRPHYRALGRQRVALGNPPVAAVTATATPATREDIARVLRLRRPVKVLHSFDRPNLHFSVKRHKDERSRLKAAASLLRQQSGTAIIYVPTRNRTDGVTAVLRRWGFNAWPYHAGLPGRDRRSLLERFLDESIDVMVATNAFGMGIDKPDVRLVLHLGVPTRPEAYYQEAGRAGRDGEQSWCSLLWVKDDLKLAAGLASGLGKTVLSQSPDHRRARREGLKTMRRYITSWHCRRRVLLEYLGEQIEKCAGCDRCGSRSSAAPRLPAAGGRL